MWPGRAGFGFGKDSAVQTVIGNALQMVQGTAVLVVAVPVAVDVSVPVPVPAFVLVLVPVTVVLVPVAAGVVAVAVAAVRNMVATSLLVQEPAAKSGLVDACAGHMQVKL